MTAYPEVWGAPAVELRTKIAVRMHRARCGFHKLDARGGGICENECLTV